MGLDVGGRCAVGFRAYALRALDASERRVGVGPGSAHEGAEVLAGGSGVLGDEGIAIRGVDSARAGREREDQDIPESRRGNGGAGGGVCRITADRAGGGQGPGVRGRGPGSGAGGRGRGAGVLGACSGDRADARGSAGGPSAGRGARGGGRGSEWRRAGIRGRGSGAGGRTALGGCGSSADACENGEFAAAGR